MYALGGVVVVFCGGRQGNVSNIFESKLNGVKDRQALAHPNDHRLRLKQALI